MTLKTQKKTKLYFGNRLSKYNFEEKNPFRKHTGHQYCNVIRVIRDGMGWDLGDVKYKAPYRTKKLLKQRGKQRHWKIIVKLIKSAKRW